MKEIRIDGVIGQGEGEISAEWVRTQLPTNGTDPIRVSIHSEGGSVFEGFAIHDAFAAYTGPKVAAIESTAFSIASYIAMPFDQVEMSPNAYFMLHNPRIEIEGDDEELRTKSQMMSDLKTNMVNAYAGRTGKTADEIKGILKAETYFNATDAVAIGLADSITQKPVQGRAFARLENMPHGVVTALFGGQREQLVTVQEIQKTYPRASGAFIVKCLLQKVPASRLHIEVVNDLLVENCWLQDRLKKKPHAAEFDESKVKRDNDGKFGSGGGSVQRVDTKSAGFKAWFGDHVNDPENASKVVDYNTDEPLVVFHGTSNDFTNFDTAEVGSKNDAGFAGAGFYFSSDKYTAADYAGEGGNVMGVYLDIKNPKIISSYEEIGSRIDPSTELAEQVRDDLIAEGYDGVIYRGTGQDDEYVVFSPEQIKVTKKVKEQDVDEIDED